MASRDERAQAIKNASHQVQHGSIWLRRAVDGKPVARPATPTPTPAPVVKKPAR